MQEQKIRVLIVDDSLVFREALARGLSNDPMIEVLPPASDPYDAWHKVSRFHPHVITCDMEMPGMNGLQFIHKLKQETSIPTVAVSSRDDLYERALKVGAAAFLCKPQRPSKLDVQHFIIELCRQIRLAAPPRKMIRSGNEQHQVDIIAIGASTGGTEALHYVFEKLPSTLPGIVIVQHIPPVFSKMFAARLDAVSAIKVREAQSGDFIKAGTALIAPGDRHMIVVKEGHRYKVVCRTGEKVNGHCPSADVLFHSVAATAGKHAVGLILTGMGVDGAKGLLEMRSQGASTLGQDERSSVVYGMPKAAFEIGAIEKQVPLDQVHQALLGKCLSAR